MPEFFSSDGSLPLQFLVIFGVILVAMLAVYALFRRFFDRGASAPVRMGSRSRQPRLGIVDIYELDQRRQLILLRRDNVEHLLLVGGPNDVVIERNVQRVAGSRLPAETMIRPEPASDMPFLPGQDEREEAPLFVMPVAMPPPLPEVEDGQAPRSDPPLFEPKLDPQDKTSRPEPAPVFATAPTPTRRERANPLRREAPPVDEPWREAAAERAASGAVALEPVAPTADVRPAGRGAISSMARQFETVLRKQAAPAAPSVPEPAGKIKATPAVTPAVVPPVLAPALPPADPTPSPAADPTPQPAPEPTLPRVAEASVLINAPEMPAPVPTTAATREPATDPVAAAMSSAPDPLLEPEPAAPPIRPAPPVQPAAVIRPAPEPIRPAQEPLRPAPQPAAPARSAVQPAARIQERNAERPAERLREQPLERPSDRPMDRPLQRPEPNVVAVKPVRPAPAPPPEDKPAPEPRRGANPFSVEEIEAEFARLLGRPLSRRD